MASFVPKAIDEVLGDLAQALIDQGSNITDMNDGAKFQALAQAYARPIAELWKLLDDVKRDSSIATARGDSQDLLFNTFGFYKNKGSVSTGSFVAIPKIGGNTDSVAIGETFLYNGSIYQATQAVALSSPFSTFTVSSASIGPEWRLAANTQVFAARTALNTKFGFYVGTGLNGQNQAVGGMQGGDGKESDDAALLRFADYIQSLTRAVYRAVYQAALGIAGLVSVTLVEFQPMIGFMTLYVDDGSNNPVVSDDLQASIQATLYEWRAGGVPIKIRAMQKITAAIDVSIKVSKGSIPDDVELAVKAALMTTLNQYTYGQTLYLSHLVGIADQVPGVLSVTVNAPTTFVSVSASQVFRPLSVSVHANI